MAQLPSKVIIIKIITNNKPFERNTLILSQKNTKKREREKIEYCENRVVVVEVVESVWTVRQEWNAICGPLSCNTITNRDAFRFWEKSIFPLQIFLYTSFFFSHNTYGAVVFQLLSRTWRIFYFSDTRGNWNYLNTYPTVADFNRLRYSDRRRFLNVFLLHFNDLFILRNIIRLRISRALFF